MLSENQKQILDKGAESGLLPTNVACKVGCRFCYEKFVKRDYDNLEFRAIPRYSDEAFEYFMAAVERNGNEDGIRPDSIVSISADTFHMGPNADFFTLGLSMEQIDTIIASASPRRPIYLYATGLDLEPEQITHLTAKHGRKFVLRLSAITFNDTLRSSVVRNSVSSDKLKRIIVEASVPRVMMMGFISGQLIEDIQSVNDLCPEGVRLLISMMQYTDAYPEDVRRMSDLGFQDFPNVIEHLATHRSDIPNVVELLFLYPPGAYAWKYRKFLRKSLEDVGDGDVVLCSGGATNVIQYLLGARGVVAEIPNPAGGSVNFATTLTTQAVIDVLRGVQERGHSVKRVFVPDNIWWSKGKYDLQARTSSDVEAAFPDLEFAIVEIPLAIVDSNLTLDECVDYYQTFDASAARSEVVASM